jgi:hypothetical protein
VVEGEAPNGYYAYLVAVDIDRSAGLETASLRIEYDDSVVLTGWYSCAEQSLAEPAWPASSSSIVLRYPSCAGTEPDAADPEGDGTVVLGGFYVYAYQAGRLALGDLDRNTRKATVVDCQGDSTTVEWSDDYAFVHLGEVAFGETGIPKPCEILGVFDDSCLLGWSDFMYACCRPGEGCAQGMAQVSQRACEYAGGSWRVLPCRLNCMDSDCRATPALPFSWGRLKARY